MTATVIFEPSVQRLVCVCKATLEYTVYDVVGLGRGTYGSPYLAVRCPKCDSYNKVHGTVQTEGVTK